MKRIRIFIAILVVLTTCVTVLAGCGGDGGKGALTEEEALKTLDALLSKVRVTTGAPRMDISGADDNLSELPDISSYPLSVQGSAAINIEIVSSTEKSGEGADGWINTVANRFNKAGVQVGGKTVSVSIRPIASGIALDYLREGVYLPDAFTPANELWGEMALSAGVDIQLTEKRLAGNTAGILMKKSVLDKFTSKYGEVKLNKVVEAVIAGDLLLGYTNPYASSTGLNILTAMLQSFDAADPLSQKAVDTLIQFQAKAPPVAFTTAQMRESARNGIIDAMVMEYQAYINEPLLKDYVFTPFGVRHDSPMYAVGALPDEKTQGLRQFVDFCRNSESQAEAKRDGFNANDSFPGEPLNLTGARLFSAQKIWKENKDAGRPVVAVFVADTSGSMEGGPITNLKASLINAAKYIGPTNYIGLVTYSDFVTIDLPIDLFEGEQKAYFTGAIKDLYAAGGTATYDAVLVALKLLEDQLKQVPNAKLMLFVLSDGEQNEGYDLNKIGPVVKALKIPVHTISYNMDLTEMETLSKINEASHVAADENNVVYNLKSIFNAQM